jgi:thymidylate kinase
VDDTRLAPEHALIGRLRRNVVKDVAPHRSAWSPEFLATLVQTAVVHLRDQLLRTDAGTPVVVDSYYYKLLAKCRLAGAGKSPLLAWWRTFPRPSRVIYLDVSPETAWQRSRQGADLNLLEHYGHRPDRDGFGRYQTDLAKVLRDEIQDLPVTVIEETDRPETTAAAIREVLTHEFG